MATWGSLSPPASGCRRWLQQQVLRALEARRDLERRERLPLRVGGLAGQQVALGQVAVRRRAIGGTDGERRLELAHGDGSVARAHRDPAEAGVPGGVERIERDDAIDGEGDDGLVVRLVRELASRLAASTSCDRATSSARYSLIARAVSPSCSASGP